jgi:protein SCO1
MNKMTLTLFATLSLSALALTGCQTQEAKSPLAGARLGGPFTLTNQDGKPVTDKDFAGQYRIMYFGFTYCPDICPGDMQALTAGLKAFEQKDAGRAMKVKPVFVSVDPARDTPAVVKEFIANFHPRFTGLTGKVEEVKEIAKAYGGSFMIEKADATGNYNVNHTNIATLYGPKGEPIVILPQDKGPDAIAAELDRWVK